MTQLDIFTAQSFLYEGCAQEKNALAVSLWMILLQMAAMVHGSLYYSSSKFQNSELHLREKFIQRVASLIIGLDEWHD